MALISLSDAKTTLGISGTAEDSKLTIMIAAASAAVQRYCGRDFESQTYGTGATTAYSSGGDSGYYNGDNSRFLILRQRPVTSITSIYSDPTGYFGDNPDGAYAASTLLVAGTDYALRWDGQLPGASTRCSYCGIVERLNSVWTGTWRHRGGEINPTLGNNSGNIKIVYVAGFTTVPSDISYAVTLVVAQMRRTAVFGGEGLSGESWENYSYNLGGSRGGGAAASAAIHLSGAADILSHWREVFI